MPTIELIEDGLVKYALTEFPDASSFERVSGKLNSVIAPAGFASRMAAVRVQFDDDREDQYVYQPIPAEVS